MLHETKQERERAILAAVNTGSYDNDYSMEELENLCETAGLTVVAQVIQNRERVENATYLGKGRLGEVKEMAQQLEVTVLVIDDELTGSQMRNIEQATGLQVLDRTMVILDIFASNALSKEGKIQVELAQYRYRLPRLIGLGSEMSRLGGASSVVGARGPGETKLELDRRHIHTRIDKLKQELGQIERQRESTRKQRQKNEVPTVAIVGYTNVGKSTLLNAMTQAEVLAENKLFATLDPTARKFTLPSNREIVFIDTVGFLSRLPHHLIDAFRSTLEVAKYADLILVVADGSSDFFHQQVDVTLSLLKDIGAGEVPKLFAINKCDLVENEMDLLARVRTLPEVVQISAKEGRNLGLLVEKIEEKFSAGLVQVEVLLPFSQGGLLHYLKEEGQILHEEYLEEGVLVKAKVDKKQAYRFQRYEKK